MTPRDAKTSAPAARSAPPSWQVRSGFTRRESTIRRLLAFADGVAVAVALTYALTFPGVARHPGRDYLLGIITLPVWILIFKLYGLYDRDDKRVSHSTIDDLPRIFHAFVVGGIGLWTWYRFAAVEPLVLREGLAFCFIGVVGTLVARAAARAVARSAIPPERVLFVGGGPMARLLVQKILAHREYRLEPVGYVDGEESAASTLGDELPFLGPLASLDTICRTHGIDRVLIAAPGASESEIADTVRRAQEVTAKVNLLPHVVDVIGPSVEIDDVEGITLLGLNPIALTRSSLFLKRTLDITLASAALVLTAPLLAAIAIAIKATSPGPVVFSQWRAGRRERHFRMHKFRTMVADAETRLEELRNLSAHPAWLLVQDDPRITRVGKYLRHTSLDELPQLWNVIKGDMSLVGPRPMPLDVDEKISGWGRRRLDLTPGITGLWQVLGRTNIPFEEMVKLDYLYVTNWSLWQDVRLLLHTLPAVLRRRGVN
jgi:exopolysaccharide biosynthesis polyprenyl glycosylphosphotransferase